MKTIKVQPNLNIHQRFSQILWLYDDIYIGICRIFKSIGMLAYRVSFFCCWSKVCSDALEKKNCHQVSYNTGACWNHNVRQQIGYKQYILIVLYIFSLHLTQFVLFTNYIFKQTIIYGRQFEFTQVKVVKLDVEHYDDNTSCGNNNVRHNYNDQACLPSSSKNVRCRS